MSRRRNLRVKQTDCGEAALRIGQWRFQNPDASLLIVLCAVWLAAIRLFRRSGSKAFNIIT
ncbi:hypothetical protein BGW36DRAFT_382960 [Talaromyces proteolyticus]|uniref:Uncharacterized protein n=1 Tax=Talaromyces proteolyticus TaxID=1131652 RepID=A0AAD4PUV9_9EURO|nr:uncharacterized protein BGW36DRAFT_382960 [Talaromyces proteolyticus]KAH8695576.1 hypothetical protein BGW36DRAFT_382960 [Talaromyces proteolyticus]